jgi:hypothetical protein
VSMCVFVCTVCVRVYCVCVGLDFVLVLIVQFVLLEQRLVVDGDVGLC